MTERATRYLVDIGERRLEICIGAPGGEITVDGEPVNVDLAGVGESDYSVLAVGRSLHMAVESAGEGGRLVVDDGRLTHDVRVQDEREARRSASSARRGSAGDGGLVQASMPGIVTQILVAAGDPVEEDQPLLILDNPGEPVKNCLYNLLDFVGRQLLAQRGESLEVGEKNGYQSELVTGT